MATEFRVVPFVANVSSKEGAAAAARQLQDLCNANIGEGWEFMGLENVDTYIAGEAGCFGIGATPGRTVSYSMAVFRR